MKIYYTCEFCGENIDMIEVEAVDERRFGFDCLTAQERRDIINLDEKANAMHVKSLCDSCIEALGVLDEGMLKRGMTFLH
jgi:hypothetical protein